MSFLKRLFSGKKPSAETRKMEQTSALDSQLSSSVQLPIEEKEKESETVAIAAPPDIEQMRYMGDEEGLTQALHYQDSQVREAASDALVDLLAGLLKFDLRGRLFNYDEQQARIRKLVELQKPQAVVPLLIFYAYYCEQTYSSWGDICHTIPAEVKKIGLSAVQPLIEAMEENNAEIQSFIDERKHNRIFPNSLQRNIRDCAVKSLVEIGVPTIESLGAALKNDDPYVREGAAKAMGQIGDAGAITPLVLALGDKYESVRPVVSAALDELGWQPDKDEEKAYYWIANSQWNQCVALGAPAVEPLISVLINDYGKVNWEVAEVLGKIGDARALEPLIATLECDDIYVYPTSNLEDKFVTPKITDALKKLGWQPPITEKKRVINELDVEPVVDILASIYSNYPDGIYSGTSAAERVREIGKEIYETGGMELMLAVHQQFAARNYRHARNLEMRWNGIGEWMG